MIDDILPYLGTAIGAGGITQIINWRVNKRKNLAEAKASEAEVRAKEIENMRKAMEDFYAPLVEKQNELIRHQDTKIAYLENKVNQLEEEKRSEAEAHAKQLSILQDQIIEISKALGIRVKETIRKKGVSSFHEVGTTDK